MSRSPSRSPTSALGAAAVAVAIVVPGGAGCGDSECGPGGAPAAGITAETDAVLLTYGNVTSRVGNDCPATGAPAGVVSLTIEAAQTDGTGLFTLCVGRPDLLAQKTQQLGHNTPGIEARIIDLTGTAGGCSFAIDAAQLVSGEVRSSGLCGNGADPAGFALTINGAVTLKRTCGANMSAVDVVLHGGVAVLPAH